MPDVNQTCMNFVGGELCPSVGARSDIKVYGNGCARIENFILEATGPAKYRTGTRFVNPTKNNSLGRLIPFQFSDEQAYLVECTPGYFRFYKDESIIVENDKSITAVDVATGEFTIASHGFSDGDEIFLNDLVGSIDVLNGRSYFIANSTSNTFTLQDEDEEDIDTTDLTYTSGGTVNKIYEILHLNYFA